MIFRVDTWGDGIPTEVKTLSGKVSSFELAKAKALEMAEQLRKQGCSAGQADVVGNGNLMGCWVWQDGVCWWESA